MPIRQTTPPINSVTLENRMKQALILKLQYVGESCVRHARKLPGPPTSIYRTTTSGKRYAKPNHQPHYADWTANLRSSIGYIVVMDGRIVAKSDFAHEKGKEGNGEEGRKEGLKYARELAAKYQQGATLIVVAGMNYAAYVQRKGYDVLTSSELLAEQLVRQLKLNAKITHLQ